MSKTRTIFPATAQDRMNYLIGLLSADQQIAMVLSFSPAGHANFEAGIAAYFEVGTYFELPLRCGGEPILGKH